MPRRRPHLYPRPEPAQSPHPRQGPQPVPRRDHAAEPQRAHLPRRQHPVLAHQPDQIPVPLGKPGRRGQHHSVINAHPPARESCNRRHQSSAPEPARRSIPPLTSLNAPLAPGHCPGRSRRPAKRPADWPAHLPGRPRTTARRQAGPHHRHLSNRLPPFPARPPMPGRSPTKSAGTASEEHLRRLDPRRPASETGAPAYGWVLAVRAAATVRRVSATCQPWASANPSVREIRSGGCFSRSPGNPVTNVVNCRIRMAGESPGRAGHRVGSPKVLRSAKMLFDPLTYPLSLSFTSCWVMSARGG